ncbi:MAG: F0F1 ATP synthase subunit B [Pseudonocardia sp.]|nr:F0F1 ATP synthase subunit B [Pseudonocardia sp.]
MSTTVLAQETNNFLLPNATFFAELFGFLLILFVFWRYIIPPLSKSLRERQDMVQKQVEDAEEAQRKLKQAEQRYDQALAEARTEAAKIRDSARADSERIREELREQAKAEVERIRQRGEEQLATQRDQVVRQLRGELGGLALQLAERLVGQHLANDDHQRATVDAFLAELDAAPSDKAGERASSAAASRRAG